jgi:antirestriction protein ArdC
MTYRQAKELGANVRKGEKGELVVYANTITRTEINVILPANDGHPVKRIHYATEVNHDKTNSSKEDDDPETVFKGIQG